MAPVINKILKVAGVAWASPNTLLGILACLMFGAQPLHRRGLTWDWVATRGGAFEWFFLRNRFIAITIGNVVVYRDWGCMLNPRVQAHEDRHVVQYMVLGPLFWPAYGIASVVSRCQGGGWYRDNVFEVDARRHTEST